MRHRLHQIPGLGNKAFDRGGAVLRMLTGAAAMGATKHLPVGPVCHTQFLRRVWIAFGGRLPLVCKEDFQLKVTSLISALVSQLGLLGSPPDPVGCFPMRGGPSLRIVPED
jgi:hypothetical protein